MIERSEIRYAKASEHHLAYREYVGDPASDVEIVMVNGAAVPMELLAEDPIADRLVEGLARLGRLVVFDRRGIGLSDAITDWETLLNEQWADDLEAVVQAVAFERPSIFSWHSLGYAATYAARHPDSIANLILFNPIANDALTADHIRVFAEVGAKIRSGEAPEIQALLLPNRYSDPAFRVWWDAAGRAGTSPGMAERLAKRPNALEFVDYSQVKCPTLVLHRPTASGLLPDDPVTVVADRIPGATYVRFPPGDNLPIGADVDEILAEVSRYLVGSVRLPAARRKLAVILFTDLVDSTRRAASVGDAGWRRVLDHHDEASRTAVERRGGEVVKATGDGILAVLPSTTAAVEAARGLRAALADEGLDVRIGIHVGEIDRRGEDISGLAVHIAARIMAEAAAGQILASEVVTLTTDGASFVSVGARHLKGVDGEWDLFAVS